MAAHTLPAFLSTAFPPLGPLPLLVLLAFTGIFCGLLALAGVIGRLIAELLAHYKEAHRG